MSSGSDFEATDGRFLRRRALEDCRDRLQNPHLTPIEKVELLCEHAQLLSQQGLCYEAIASCDRALNLQPDNATAFYYKALALEQSGRCEDAIAQFDRAIEVSPTPVAHLWNDRGNVLRTLGRHKDALASYDQALVIDPESVKTLSNRGSVLAMLGRHKEALESCDRALALQPNSVEALNSRGIALMAAKRHQESLHYFERAVTIDPTFNRAWNNRGIALLRLDRTEAAISSLETALHLSPNQSEPWYAYTWMYHGYGLMRLGEFERAIASFDKALQRQPDLYAASLYRLGCLVLTGNIITHACNAGTRQPLFHSVGIFFKHLRYRLLAIVGILLLLHYGQGEWFEAIKKVLPFVFSFGIVTLVVADLWKNRSRLHFIWKTYIYGGILTYLRAFGILIATLTTYAIADPLAPPFLHWGWSNLIFGQPGNILFQPFNLLQSIVGTEKAIASIPHLMALLPLSFSTVSASLLAQLGGHNGIPYRTVLAIAFWFILVLGIPFWARLEERIFRRGANTWRQIAVRSTQFGLVHLLAGIPILAGFVLIVPGFLFACRYKYVHDRHLRRTQDSFQAQEVGVFASTADHAVYNAILVTLVVLAIVLVG